MYPVTRSSTCCLLAKSKYVLCLSILTLIVISPTSAYSELTSKQQNNALNADTQAINKEAIELISQLKQLEEKLLYPAHTEVSVFLSVSASSLADPNFISIKIDNNNVTNHVYTQEEVKALKSGGIQRLYTGNTMMGKHKLIVTLHETLKDGTGRQHNIEYNFNKTEKVKFLEIIVGNNNTSNDKVNSQTSNQYIVIKGMN